MNQRHGACAVLACLALLPAATFAHDVVIYRGMCDASAAVALDANHFAVADDEHNTLQVYRRGKAKAVTSLTLDEFLGTKRESDLEGSATIGGVTYWIASHGRNADGELRKDRHRFFATEVVPGSKPPALRTRGKAYRKLLDDLKAAPALLPFKLAEASQRAAEAPGGLNIEGLAATPDGHLLIGFRNPVPADGALLVELVNPQDVLADQPARIGAVFQLQLGGRGIRSIERVGASYLIVAGPPADEGSFALYRWSGQAHAQPTQLGADFKGLGPEALFEIPGTQTVQVLSDDGGVKVGGVACKKLPAKDRSFRSLTLDLPR